MCARKWKARGWRTDSGPVSHAGLWEMLLQPIDSHLGTLARGWRTAIGPLSHAGMWEMLL